MAKNSKAANVKLIETILFKEKSGFSLLDLHLARLKKSAKHFSYSYDDSAVQSALYRAVESSDGADSRVRLLMTSNGALEVEAFPFVDDSKGVWQIILSKVPTLSTNKFLQHKTTNRTLYDGERQRYCVDGAFDEVIFLNEKGELCEGSITNLYLEFSGKLLTPPIECGLLPGVLRAHLLATGKVEKQRLTMHDLKSADAIYVGNALRGLKRARFNE